MRQSAVSVEVAVAIAVAVLSMSACGGSAPPPVAPISCPLVVGTFVTYATLVSAEGSCSLAKESSKDTITFDKKGALVSPAEGLVWCTTVQENCEVRVHCSTNLVRAKGQFDGLLSEDGVGLQGVAVVTGSFQGCFQVIYDVTAKRK